MNDYDIVFMRDGYACDTQIVADTKCEAIKLFKREHPTLHILSIREIKQ